MKTTILFLAAALVAVPFAAADETNPDCEKNVDYGTVSHPTIPGKTHDGGAHDQDWIGYESTNSVTDTYEALGSPGGLYACEGEHWDGQDTVNTNDGATDDCLTQLDTSNGAALCTDDDLNNGDADPTQGASPVAIRVSNAGTQVYVGANIFSVGRAAVYTDGSNTAAVYLRDNTPLNLLAQAVSAPGITKGFPSEGDCSQATYEAGATDSNPDTARTWCGRDNTAVTVNFLLA